MPPSAVGHPVSAGARTRLYLHAGMPKTGTTALQHVLHGNRSTLARQGYVYPEAWLKGTPPAHHDLTDAIGEEPERRATIVDEVGGYLGDHRAESVILSAEGLAGALLEEPTRARFAAFIERCAAEADTTVVICLRRLDEFLASAYLQQIKAGGGDNVMTAERYVARPGRRWTRGLFPGIRWLRDQAGVELVLIPYLEGGDSLPDLLGALGIDSSDLSAGPGNEVNRRFGLKAQAVFMLPDPALEVLGVRNRQRLVELFGSGEFDFRDEIYDYDVLSRELRLEIHAEALDQARRHGIAEYTHAFSDVDPRPAPQAVPDTSLLSVADLDDLARALKAQRQARRGRKSRDGAAERGRARAPADHS